ncbi:MAG: hypothetical protein NTV51_18005 [Verrucomicrobia bacterium]|nr:hypothetical protein [Verrucomicrobiota bacterium]
MRPLPHALASIVAAALFTGTAPAQTATDAPPPAIPEAAPNPTVAAPERPRAISPAIAARLAEKMPKFTPPKSPAESASSPASPVLIARKTAPELPDLRELDRPRNTIIRLPDYVVREEKPEAFKERHLLTPSGRLQLGYKRYPGLHFGSLPFSFLSNDGWALLMLEEDYRLERKAEMESLLTVLTSPSDHAKAKTEVQKAFMRTD